ncbi:MAG: hypothetical protein IKE52_01375 [Mogibacterium sp.]|nr:hypothetical protein [Mogibacterium sp.]
MKNKIISLITAFTLIISVTASSFATDETFPKNVNGEEILDEVTEALIEGGDYSAEQEDEIADDVETLDGLGLNVECIEEVEDRNGELTYMFAMSDEITDEIVVNQKGEAIVMDVFEGDKHDEVVVRDGRVFLDGKEIIIETEGNYIKTSCAEDNYLVVSETGGSEWYASSNAPSKLTKAKYKAYSSTPRWKTANISLTKSLVNITYGGIIAILSSAIPGAFGITVTTGMSGFIGLGTSAFMELVNKAPDSKGLSCKDWIVRGETNSRYMKKRTYWWAKKYYGWGTKAKYEANGKKAKAVDITEYTYGMVI